MTRFKTGMRGGLVVLVCGLAADCANLQAPACPAQTSAMIQADLYFGLAIPGGGQVPEEEWRRFADQEITPRFPDGLTVTDASGQWRDRNGIVREGSKRVTIIIPAHDAARLDAVRTAYRTRFHQDSVLLTETHVCAAF